MRTQAMRKSFNIWDLCVDVIVLGEKECRVWRKEWIVEGPISSSHVYILEGSTKSWL